MTDMKSTAIEPSAPVGVIGAGTMGAGIAQLAAAAGHAVLLYDAAEGATDKAKARIARGLDKLVDRGKIERATVTALLDRIEPVATMSALSDAALVVEAVAEDLDVKRAIFTQLEDLVAADTVLATNTSSISITQIARDLAQPWRVIGMHFFNPAPIMKLVEVVSGIATDPRVAERVFATAEAWGKIAVHAKSTPGFIVNRVARPFYGEALRLLEEQVADPATLDALMTEGGRFRMGPFALIDLIGNDVNYAVSVSVFEAYYQEPRFRPSALQREFVNAGYLGRKSGRGFYDHGDGVDDTAVISEVDGRNGAAFDDFDLATGARLEGVAMRPTDGRPAFRVAAEQGVPAIVYDLYVAGESERLAFAASAGVSDAVIERFVATLNARGIKATKLPDWPGLVLMRTVAMLANEGFEAVLQGVTDEAGVDRAMRYGVNYPRGPMGWAREIGLARVLQVLDALHALTGDPRYRASYGLRMAASAAIAPNNRSPSVAC